MLELTAQQMDDAIAAARETIAQKLGVEIRCAAITVALITTDGRKIGASAFGPGALKAHEILMLCVGHQQAGAELIRAVDQSVTEIDKLPAGTFAKVIEEARQAFPEPHAQRIDRSKYPPPPAGGAGPQSFSFKFPN